MEYEKIVMSQLIDKVPSETLKGPLFIKYRFYFKIPKSAIRKTMTDKILEGDYCTINRDVDNLMKNINDIIEKMGFIENDCNIVRASVQKNYSHDPRTVIWICQLLN